MHWTLPFSPSLGQRRHHLQRIAQDHAVRPVLVMRIELGPRIGRNAVEIGEQVGHRFRIGLAGRGALEVFDQHLGVDFLLDIQRRDVDHEVRPVLPILTPPH